MHHATTMNSQREKNKMLHGQNIYESSGIRENNECSNTAHLLTRSLWTDLIKNQVTRRFQLSH